MRTLLIIRCMIWLRQHNVTQEDHTNLLCDLGIKLARICQFKIDVVSERAWRLTFKPINKDFTLDDAIELHRLIDEFNEEHAFRLEALQATPCRVDSVNRTMDFDKATYDFNYEEGRNWITCAYNLAVMSPQEIQASNKCKPENPR